jgi:hypothetical protein
VEGWFFQEPKNFYGNGSAKFPKTCVISDRLSAESVARTAPLQKNIRAIGMIPGLFFEGQRAKVERESVES